LPQSPGRAERHGFEYYRHGTLWLDAALDTQTGKAHGKTARGIDRINLLPIASVGAVQFSCCRVVGFGVANSDAEPSSGCALAGRLSSCHPDCMVCFDSSARRFRSRVRLVLCMCGETWPAISRTTSSPIPFSARFVIEVWRVS
jgi:hypothetical protein